MWQLLLLKRSHSFQALLPGRRHNWKIHWRSVAWIYWHIEGVFHNNGSNKRMLRNRRRNYQKCERPTDKDKSHISVLHRKSVGLWKLQRIFLWRIELSQRNRNCRIWRRRVRCRKRTLTKKNRVFSKHWILKLFTTKT